jgi:hypothetical protein
MQPALDVINLCCAFGCSTGINVRGQRTGVVLSYDIQINIICGTLIQTHLNLWLTPKSYLIRFRRLQSRLWNDTIVQSGVWL